MSRSESLGSAPATNAWASTTERVPRAGRRGRRGPAPSPRSSAASWERPGQRPRLAQRVGVEVGQAVDGDRTVVVVEQDGGADGGGVGADVDAGGVDQPGAEAEPLGGVVVAAGDHHPRAGRGQPGEGLVGQADRVDRRQRPVVDVAGDHDQVDPLALDDVEQVVDVRRLVLEHALAVEGPPEVPVGGVEDAHGTTVRTLPPTARRTHAARRRRCAPSGGGRLARRVSPGMQGELHAAGLVDGGVEDLVVELLRGVLVEVDGRAALLDGLVAGLGGGGGGDLEGGLVRRLAGDPQAAGLRDLVGDVLDDRAGVLGEGEHGVLLPIAFSTPPPLRTSAHDTNARRVSGRCSSRTASAR